MRVVERRQLALAHEFPRPDLDDRDPRRIVEMRNDPLGHMFVRIYPRRCDNRVNASESCWHRGGRGTIASGGNDG